MHSCSTLLYDSFSIIRKIWTQTPELNTVSKGKTRVSAGFFYIFMALEIVIEIEPGSKWHSPWVSKHPPLPTTAPWPSYSSCHWNSFMTFNILTGENECGASVHLDDTLPAVKCKHFIRILSKRQPLQIFYCSKVSNNLSGLTHYYFLMWITTS